MWDSSSAGRWQKGSLERVPGAPWLETLLKRHLLFLATAEASSSLLWFCSSSFLADLMDNSELIRNVTLCGHLHHGKVVQASAVWRVVAVLWLMGAVPVALEPSVGLCRLLLLLWE